MMNLKDAALPLAVIPARMAATRFPGKPLAKISGKPMVQHVYDRCVESGAFCEVIVATDAQAVLEAVRAFGGKAALTSPTCASGSDRVAELALATGAPLLVNVQGDEPAIHPESLRAVAAALQRPDVQMSTAVRPLKEEERANPNVVKAVVGAEGFALYFSRADLPYGRVDVGAPRWAHLGVYGYRASTLLAIARLPPTAIERTESLEQLRAVEHGIRIYCAVTPHASIGVDTPEDVAPAEALLRALKT